MSPSSFDEIPGQILIRINELCNRFEQCWRTSDPVTIESLLDAIDPRYRSALAVELIGLEAEFLMSPSRAEVVGAETYVLRFPDIDASLIRAVVESAVVGTPTPELPSEQLAESTRIGEYTILETIGAGGMGRVYKAIHRRMNRVVAVKLVLPERACDPRFRARFNREVQVAARLRHPNIVAAYDAGEYRDRPYLVLEYVEGSDLRRIVRDTGPLPPDKALDVIVQAAHGLRYIHQQGIIHRDIKPANLLLDESGRVRILDVGLSCLKENADEARFESEGELTDTGAVMGTITYMAPEQARSSRDADERSDIYSLGCTLFFLLTGRHCFDGSSSLARILAHSEEPIPLLESPHGTVPDPFNTVFRRMLAKRAADRPATAEELILMLEACRTADGIEFANRQDSDRDPRPTSQNQPRQLRFGVGTKRVPRIIKWLVLAVFLIPAGVGFVRLSWNRSGEQLLRTREPAEPMVPLRTVASDPARANAPFSADEARQLQHAWAQHLGIDVLIHDERIGVDLMLIPPGEFTMGSSPEQLARIEASYANLQTSEWPRELLRSETPLRRVAISQPFYLSRTEVSIAQFRRFVDATDYVTSAEQTDLGGGVKNGRWVRAQGDLFSWQNVGEATAILSDTHPVGNLVWEDAVAYCLWCSQGDWVYRLPTEAEWEYACRAGTETDWSWGDHPALIQEFAVVLRPDQSHDAWLTDLVANRRANPFGLCDMHGNVSEFCRDLFDWNAYATGSSIDPTGPELSALGHTGARVSRGGYVASQLWQLRSAARDSVDTRNPTCTGIRLLREIVQR